MQQMVIADFHPVAEGPYLIEHGMRDCGLAGLKVRPYIHAILPCLRSTPYRTLVLPSTQINNLQRIALHERNPAPLRRALGVLAA